MYANALDMWVLAPIFLNFDAERVYNRHRNFAPTFKGRYLTSNVNITVPDQYGNPVSVPVGSTLLLFPYPRPVDVVHLTLGRFAKFKTRKYVERDDSIATGS